MSSALQLSSNGGMRQLQLALLHCAAEASATDTRSFELAPEAGIVETLIPKLCSSAAAAIGIFEQILSHYDAPAHTAGAASSGVFNAVFEDMVENVVSDQHQRVADVAFMARWEIERKRSLLTAAATRKRGWALLSECCSTRRRVLKATSGVERVLSEVEGQASVFDDLYRTERQIAVETRAAYYVFVSDLAKAERDLGDRDVARVIRLAGTGIAQLIGRDIYDDLRIEDRMEMRRLQVRLFAWLRQGTDAREAHRLMGDIRAFASLIMQVNGRPALIEHDRHTLTKLAAALRMPGTDKVAFYRILKSIRGRDEHLDRLINGYADLQERWWGPQVSRVLASLSEPTANGGS